MDVLYPCNISTKLIKNSVNELAIDVNQVKCIHNLFDEEATI